MNCVEDEYNCKQKKDDKEKPEDEKVKEEPMRLCKKSYLKEFRHVVKMLPVRLPGEEYHVCPARRTPRDRPRTYWRHYTSHVALEHLNNLQERLVYKTNEGMVWII